MGRDKENAGGLRRFGVQMFQAITSREQLANLLGVSFRKHLVYYLYRMSEAQRYTSFTIPKKAGGTREILAPHYGLKHIQRRLADLLLDAYTPRRGVHSYVRGASILTNASTHNGQRHVLNIDLENFFPSINFGRVRGIFRAQPYLASAEIATVLAQICCHKNHLPQGAPTSPIVSNMICAGLDAELRKLAREYRGRYSRYCDDITFSTSARTFPREIARPEISEEGSFVLIGENLQEAIQRHGFFINEKKSRLLSRSDRQEVTGLVVNDFSNVRRTYVRNIRASLHAWQKFGPDALQKQFQEKYFSGGEGDAPSFTSVLYGKIQYVGAIRGFDDPVYAKLRDKYNELSERKIRLRRGTWQHTLDNAIWIIEDEASTTQATAFFFGPGKLVTCFHCVDEKPYIYHPRDPKLKYKVRLVAGEPTIDLAILEVVDAPPDYAELRINKSAQPRRHEDITLAGYPNHGHGKQLREERGHIVSLQTRSGVERFTVSASIVAGNSGGPVYNARREVIGVAVTGGENEDEAKRTDERGVICIKMLDQVR